jgi:hypothetical protein
VVGGGANRGTRLNNEIRMGLEYACGVCKEELGDDLGMFS